MPALRLPSPATFRALTWVLAVSYALVALVWPPSTQRASVVGNLLFVASVAAVACSACRLARSAVPGSARQRSWRWFAVAFAVPGVAGLLLLLRDLIAWGTPIPPAARAIYLVGYAAYWAAVRAHPVDATVPLSTRARWLDRLIVATVGVVVLGVVLQVGLADAGTPALDRVLQVAFPLCDLVSLYLVASRVDRVRHPARRRALILLGAALPFDLVIDLFYSELLHVGPLSTALATALCYAVPYLLLAQAVFVARDGDADAPTASRPTTLYAPTVAVGCMWAILGAALTGVAHLPMGALLLAVGTITLLVLLRQLDALRDATEALAARDAAEARFGAVVEHSADVILLLDDEGRCTYVSPSVERLVGVPPAGVLGRVAADLVVEDDRAAVRAAFGAPTPDEMVRVPDTGSTFRVRHIDGTTRDVEIALADRRSDPALRAMLVSARDVTERLALQAHVREHQTLEVVGRLAGGIAHDFNNLLAVVRGNAELLEFGFGADSVPSIAANIRAAADRGAALTQRLLSFSRRDGDAVQSIAIDDVVGATRPLIERVVAKGITVRFDLEAPHASVRIDPLELERALLNLAVNARDAMPTGGTLTIGTTVEDELVLVRVEDTGTGIDAATLARLFTPMFTTKPKGRGTGLGLHLTRVALERVGGRIDVASTVGVGTTFTLRFPRVAVPDAAVGHRADEPSAAAVGNDVARASTATPGTLPRASGAQRLLVVDDEADVRDAVAASLRACGFHVDTASSVDDAIRRLDAAPRDGCDLVITDMVMPERPGTELVNHLRGRRPALPVLMVSGFVGDLPDAQAQTLAGVPILSKPVSTRELVTTINTLLAPVAAAA
ncbi:MAG: ATP-binding protein [Gemmatimonadaceae bacterium]|jgi:PAS domain S-box-containing protein|nr:ATP-binding protein [Gemmatimonadaceae bacterium]